MVNDFFCEKGEYTSGWFYVGKDIPGINEGASRPYALKIEVGALNLEDAYKIYDTIAPVLDEYEGQISYKFPLKKNFIEDLNEENKARQRGSLFVIYTKSDEDAFTIAKKLDAALTSIKDEISHHTGLASLDIGNSGNLAMVIDRDVKGEYLARTSGAYDIGRDIHPEIFTRLQKTAEENGLITPESRAKNEEKFQQMFGREKTVLTEEELEKITELRTSKAPLPSVAYIFENYEIPENLIHKAIASGLYENDYRAATDIVYLDSKGFKKEDIFQALIKEYPEEFSMCWRTIARDIIPYFSDPITINDIEKLVEITGINQSNQGYIGESLRESIKICPEQEKEIIEGTSLLIFKDKLIDLESERVIIYDKEEYLKEIIENIKSNIDNGKNSITDDLPEGILKEKSVHEAIAEYVTQDKESTEYKELMSIEDNDSFYNSVKIYSMVNKCEKEEDLNICTTL